MTTTKALVIGLVLGATVAARAQDVAELPIAKRSPRGEESLRTLDFRKIEASYLINLNSNVAGIVESTLGHITLMRIAYPKQNLRKLEEKLYDLASRGETRSIRYKAFIAMQVFANPGAFKESIVGRGSSGDGLLEEIAAQR